MNSLFKQYIVMLYHCACASLLSLVISLEMRRISVTIFTAVGSPTKEGLLSGRSVLCHISNELLKISLTTFYLEEASFITI